MYLAAAGLSSTVGVDWSLLAVVGYLGSYLTNLKDKLN